MRELDVKCEAFAKINPSEDPGIIEQALKSLIYPGVRAELKVIQDEVIMIFSGPSCLKKMKEQAAARRVRAVLRRLLKNRYSDGKVTLMLNRQALTAGIIAYIENPAESPLGPVYLNIYTDDIDSLSSYLTGDKDFQS